MSLEFKELEYWRFDILEVSANIFKVMGKDKWHHSIELTGTDPDKLLDDCKKYASDIILSRNRPSSPSKKLVEKNDRGCP